MLEVRDGTLWNEGAPVPPEQVQGFEERFDPWSGEVRLRVRGLGADVGADEGYGALRASLRRAFGDRPFVATWSDGVFPHGWFGSRAVVGAGVAVLGLVAVAVLGAHWPPVGVGAGALLAWAALRMVARVRVTRAGVAAGPAWAPRVPWHAVTAAHVAVEGGVARVAIAHRDGWCEGEVPEAVLPALRARVRRLGGLELVAMPGAVELGYQRWREPAWGAAWGFGLGALAAVAASPAPWELLPLALGMATAGALLGVAVAWRASGWGAGAAFLLSLLYALGFTALTAWLP